MKWNRICNEGHWNRDSTFKTLSSGEYDHYLKVNGPAYLWSTEFHCYQGKGRGLALFKL